MVLGMSCHVLQDQDFWQDQSAPRGSLYAHVGLVDPDVPWKNPHQRQTPAWLPSLIVAHSPALSLPLDL